MAINRDDRRDATDEAERDPVLRSLMAALPDDEPLTPEDEAALLESAEDIRAGRVSSLDVVRRRLGLERRRQR
jgi:hypothetical protein